MATPVDHRSSPLFWNPPKPSLGERIFPIIALVVVGTFLGLGFFMRTIKAIPQAVRNTMAQVRTEFVVREREKPAEQPKPIAPKTRAAEPIDLTKNPVLNQKQDDTPPAETPSSQPVRRVYGLRRVYSVGLGAGGDMSDAVIGKLGNTLSTDVDTLTATEAELKGQVVSVTTITTPPRIRNVVKPEYTKEMLENRIEGVVRVRVLVDIDGKVKKATALGDLGFGSGQKAMEACLSMEFDPAMRDNEKVAVWIVVSIRFKLLG